MRRALSWGLFAAAFALPCLPVRAGRPLSTDDAGTTARGECQLEAWGEWQHERHGGVISPACGLTDTLELNAAYARSNLPTGRDEQAGAGAKWADPDVTAFGWQLGASAAVGWQRSTPGASWRYANGAATLLASREVGDAFAAHANLGHEWRSDPTQSATIAAAALTWTPLPALMVFGEVNADDREPPWRSTGARWWLQAERLALDLTLAKQNGTPRSTTWSLGFGWYGLGLH